MSDQDESFVAGAMDGSEATCVILRFKEHAPQVMKLLSEDRGFRAICEDYALAVAMLGSLEQKFRQEPDPVLREYRVMVSELEEEIAARLQART
jgi:hypothetical protein